MFFLATLKKKIILRRQARGQEFPNAKPLLDFLVPRPRSSSCGRQYTRQLFRAQPRARAPPLNRPVPCRSFCKPTISPQNSYLYPPTVYHQRKSTTKCSSTRRCHATTFHATFIDIYRKPPLPWNAQAKSVCSRIGGRSERALELGAESLLCLLLLTLQMARRLWECVAVTKWRSSRMSLASYVVRVFFYNM